MPEYTLKESAPLADGEERAAFVATLIEEDTICEAELLDVQEKLAPFKDRDTGADVWRVEFTFKLPEYNQRIWGETSNKFSAHPDCVLRGWTQELLGGNELPVGFHLNTNDLIGLKCRVRVGVRTWEDKKQPIDPETGKYPLKSRNFVADVMHARTPVAARAFSDEEPF